MNRHSPHFRMAVNAAVRSTSAFGWNGDPQICPILMGNRRPEIGWDDSGNSRFSPKIEVGELVRSVRIAAHYRRTVQLTLLAISGRWRMRDHDGLIGG